MAKGIPIYKLAQTNKPLRVSAPILLVRLNEMMEWAASIHDPECVTELHNMRIAAKRLRYSLEFFTPTLGSEAEALLRIVEDIQEQIGAIHDCDVIAPLVSETLEKELARERRKTQRNDGAALPFVAAQGLVALMVRKREERTKRYNSFLAFWDALPPEAFVSRFTRLVSDENSSGDPLSVPFDDPTS